MGSWKQFELGQKRDDKLMEPGEPKLHFGFDANCTNHAKVTRRRDGVVEECRLTNPRLPANDEFSTQTKAYGLEEAIQRCLLLSAIHELQRNGPHFAGWRRCQPDPSSRDLKRSPG